MHRPLMHIHDLVSESWKAFRTNWNQAFVYSKWILIGPIIILLPLLIFSSTTQNTQIWIYSIGNLISSILMLWATARLTIWALAKELNQRMPPKEARYAWFLLPSFFWIAILSTLAITGGLVVFIFPGIWLAILFHFAPLFFFSEGKRGTQALAASAALVKGRWWPVFWRLMISGFIFLVIYTAFLAIVGACVGFIAGWTKLSTLASMSIGTPTAITEALRVSIQGLGGMIFAPLFVWVEVKLFHALKETMG